MKVNDPCITVKSILDLYDDLGYVSIEEWNILWDIMDRNIKSNDGFIFMTDGYLESLSRYELNKLYSAIINLKSYENK